MKKAETEVQFFSHLNGLVLDNKWGDMLRLLDTCLVYGLKLPDITTIEIQDEGKILIEFKSQHKCLLFQCVTLSDFTPNVLNDKYRIVGVPTQTQILISSDLEKQSIDKIGTASLSSLDYEIVFSANTKRVYRAKNPTSQHPFIRVDESTASEDGSGIYNETYAKYAMVGLHENMTHIDDYLDASKLQLPLDSSDLSKNYKISGTGTSVLRGWSRWYYARASSLFNGNADTSAQTSGTRSFSIFGDKDAFYFMRCFVSNNQAIWQEKQISGCGLYGSSETHPWFLMSTLATTNASNTLYLASNIGSVPLAYSQTASSFLCVHSNEFEKLKSHLVATPIIPDLDTGRSNIYGNSNVAPLQVPFYDSNKVLRGTLKHIFYSGKREGFIITTPILSETSMYIYDNTLASGSYIGGAYAYLGEIT